jgi:2,3-bisphosphoglycerate-dependent phosphoglycerate mutase
VAPTFRTPASNKPFAVEVLRSRSRRKPSSAGAPPSSPDDGIGVLVLVRHGESEFNRQDRFTGLRNPPLTAAGVQEAIDAGRTLQARGFRCDVAFTSKLERARRSLRLILDEIGASSAPAFEEAALNERDYGELAGLTRDAARARWGAARVELWRRSYEAAPPGGESLSMTAARTLPFFEKCVWPLLIQGKRVLVVAHGNSIRSIVMSLDGLTPDQIVHVSFATGTILIYRLTADGKVGERTSVPVMHR